MAHRDGKNIRGTHTTLTDLAAQVVDLALTLANPEVSGISPGYIQAGKGGGKRRVKMGIAEDGSLFLTVRQAHTIQELRIYSPDTQKTRLDLARALRDSDIPISFQH